jgi:hypothetical protein
LEGLKKMGAKIATMKYGALWLENTPTRPLHCSLQPVLAKLEQIIEAGVWARCAVHFLPHIMQLGGGGYLRKMALENLVWKYEVRKFPIWK